ncbi:glycoside hydrolase domain-containing protein [Kitasatospora griseola]|uniref:glycoside hydrolase domain-containing protein n=1 Tax=Kitasatospora griseola TaxID=2064 RepID=UPI0036570500
MKPHRRALATAATALALAATALGTVPAFAAGASDGATKNVDYLGRTFSIPADWPVIDLSAAPRTCVRFDRHALYLGTPGADQDCPSHVIGRTEALLVQPAAGEPVGTTVNDTGREIAAADGTVRITAAYDTDQALVTGILTGAAIPAKAPAKAAALGAGALTAAAVPATSTNYTGKGFDACAAPSSSLMAGWMADSPYRAVGIYIGGSNRGCAQPNLTPGWVSQQAAAGWHFMPLYVGPQAAGISSPAGQGAAAADDAINNAVALGFGPGSVLYYDMEAYSPTYSSKVLAFESAWTERLHARGYLSAIYSSSDSGIADLANHVSAHTMPDVVYFARWNRSADTNDPAVPASYWAGHQRVHQYSGNVTESYHGYSLEIDADYLDVQVAQEPVVPAGVLYHSIVSGGGSWAGFAPLAGVGTPTMLARESAITGMPDGTAQVVGIGSDGNVYHEARLTDGNWTGFAPLAGVGTPTMQASKVAIAGMPDGTAQVVAIGSDGNVYHEIRLPNGSWSGFAPLAGVGTSTMQAREVAIAAMPDGSAQVVAIGSDGNVYHETRLTNGSWSGFAPLAGVGTPTMLASKVAIAGLPDGSAQVVAIGSDGKVYHETRLTNAGWTGFAPLDGVGTSTMQAFEVAIAGLPNGTSQVLAIGSDHQAYSRVRLTDANWTAFQAMAGHDGAATFPAQRVAVAAMPDGSTQVLATTL